MSRRKPLFSSFSAVRSPFVALTLGALGWSVGGCALFNQPQSFAPEPVAPYQTVQPPRQTATVANVDAVNNGNNVKIDSAPSPTRAPKAPATVPTFREVASESSTQAVQKPTETESVARGQVAGNAATAPAPASPSPFPTLGSDFPTVDAPLAPPTESELPDFIANGGADVPEPSRRSLYDAETTAEPSRKSLSDAAQNERELEANYNAWLEKQKAKQKEEEKIPEYLRPLPDDRALFNDPSSPFARRNDDKENEFIRQVTAADLSMMTESQNGPGSRELLDWEKETPLPVDWSKYPLTIAKIRDWLGMGPDEREALEYMRQACEKQNEYTRTKEPKLLKEAAILYERAAKKWPGKVYEDQYGDPKNGVNVGVVNLDPVKEEGESDFELAESDEEDDAFKIPLLRIPAGKFDRKESGPNSALIEEDGLFYAGECWFFYKDYNRALRCYKTLISTYNASVYKKTATRRLYYIGCYWTEVSERNTTPSVNLTEKDKPRFSSFAGACEAFKTIYMNDASDSGLAPAALFALANAYMRRGVNQGDGAFAEAAQHYKQLYEFYPGSKYAEDACQLAMIALHKSYQGPMYDEGPLVEARRLAETALKSGRGNVDVINEELDNIKEEQARHLFVAGQYYEKRGNFASARSFYNRLVREHPNSDYASEGARAYENIASKPAEADQFAWIRTVAPFMPKSKNQYFEEAPAAELSEIARRDERLDQIGKEAPLDDEKTVREERVAAEPETSPKRF